ncbi:TPA: fibronectin type III domain-containing protein [Candidatus Poribacteria bacterium]|nr:fibronectin type III domain-containing protein [Candidatus Poribacteria bacterium]
MIHFEKKFMLSILLFILFLIVLQIACADNSPVTDIIASDVPNDDGSAIQLKWKKSLDVLTYEILRSELSGDMKSVGKVNADSNEYIDTKLERNKAYYYIIRAKDKSGKYSDSPIIGPVIPTAQWFNMKMLPVGIAVIVFSALVIFYIFYAKSGKNIFIRRIAGLDAIDEAIGRATEMGSHILYISGTGSIRSIATIASMNILARVARLSAEYNTPLYIPCNDPVVMNIEREIVQNAHVDAGHPETYSQDKIYFVAEEQFAYAAAVDGIIMRERPATIFYMGSFLAESLIFSEVGSASGAVQIAGTDSITQLPFFITTCDYTLMGEELYAASAYLSKDPLLLGSLKGQDYGKLAVVVLILIGVVMQLIGFDWFINMMSIR